MWGKYRYRDFQLTKDVTLELVGGHSEGTQVVRIESKNELAYYPGDILPMEVNHLVPLLNIVGITAIVSTLFTIVGQP